MQCASWSVSRESATDPKGRRDATAKSAGARSKRLPPRRGNPRPTWSEQVRVATSDTRRLALNRMAPRIRASLVVGTQGQACGLSDRLGEEAHVSMCVVADTRS
jgi:hypothetical protein